jgi:CheY-like chemotaxis protein
MERLQVLIADDSPTVRRYIRRIMELHFPDTAISEAANGWEALKVLERSPLDLIFLDVIMPAMQGDEFLERALDLIHSRRTRVIVLSSVNTLELRHRLEGDELVSFTQKPILMDELRQKAGAVLDLARAKKQAGEEGAQAATAESTRRS